MTTPTHYVRTQLKRLLRKDLYSLYHWTSIESMESILKDGYLYSKAMLFGKHYYHNPHILNQLNRNDVLAETKNGFLDYVFLGNTNWYNYGGQSYYGCVCFVIKPEKILPFREFFVFPFNSGRKFLTSPDKDKTSDTRTLIEALEQKHPCFEILIRRRIKISNNNVNKIICPEEYKSIVEQLLSDVNLEIPIETMSEPKNMENEESIILFDPLDKKKRKRTLRANQYIRKNDWVYVKTELSNCILALRINAYNQLVDANTKEIVGNLISIKPSPTYTCSSS